jgi:hypothetical protein
MRTAKWVLTSVSIGVAVALAGAFAQAGTEQGQSADQDRAMSDQPLGPSPAPGFEGETEIEIEHKDVDRSADINGSRDVTIKREVETEEVEIERPRAGIAERRAAMRQDLQRDDSELRQWGDMERAGPPQRQAMRAPATRPSAADLQRRQAARPALRPDVDIFIFEDEAGELPGYWTAPSGRAGEVYGFRGEPGPDQGSLYGYREEETMRMRGTGPARIGAVIEPAPEDASHDWSEGTNLVDDNLIQNRDSFDVPRDFYTKEWKVSAPPLVAHPHFHTIYDSELTQRYYSPWHGSPVNWAPNAMVQVPLPEPTNTSFSGRQLATYFTPWEQGEISTTANTFMTGTAGRTFATRGVSGEVYGYAGDELELESGMSGMSRDGAFFSSGQVLYFDDQDLLRGPSAAGGTMGGGILGFVSPEAEAGTITIDSGVSEDANLHLNVPRSTGVSIYGVPTGTEESVVEVRTVETETYGYVGEEDWGARDQDHHKADKDCK